MEKFFHNDKGENAMKKVIIMGAAGRDFHNFNTYFRGNKDYRVVAFTATQIPDIEGRKYPAALAGALYPKGIPIHAEAELDDLIENLEILANQELVESIKESERAKERGETEKYTVEELKEELQLSDEDLQETEDVDFE